MNVLFSEADIMLKNAQALGIDLTVFYDEIGKIIAEKLIKEYGKNKNYGVICGVGGNSGDGLATAFHLSKMGAQQVTAYLSARKNQIENKITKAIFEDVVSEAKDNENFIVKQDAFSKDISKHDFIVEALVGTGLKGNKLYKRFRDIIKRVTHFGVPIIALDVPTPHYTPKKTYSILFPKTETAYVIDIKLPKQIEIFCGPGEHEFLWKPNKKTHKNKNGNLLYISQSNNFNNMCRDQCKKYESNLSIFNFEQSSKIKKGENEIRSEDLEVAIQKADSIVLGDLKNEVIQRATVNYLIKKFTFKKWIVSGYALKVIDNKLIRTLDKIVIVLELDQLKLLFGEEKGKNQNFEGKIKRFCIQNKANVSIIGSKNTMYNDAGNMKRVVFENKVDSNKFLFKAASYSTKNDLWLSMRAAVV